MRGGDRQPFVGGGWTGRRAGSPEPPLLRGEFVAVPEFVERHLPHDHARGFEVDPLVLDAHQDQPRRRVPADRQFERHRLDELIHEFPHVGAVPLHRCDRGPVVVGGVEVVPRHLVHAHRHHRFEHGVEPRGNEATGRELVEVEDRRVGVVEDQRVAERLVPLVVRRVVANEREQAVVDLAGLVEVAADLGPLGGHRVGRRGVSVEDRRPGRGDGVRKRGKLHGGRRGLRAERTGR